MRIKNCRICNHRIIHIISLGNIPIVNYFLSQNDLKNVEKKFNLTLCLCTNCGLVQINEIVPPEKLFTVYHYFSSTSLPLKKHLNNLAEITRVRYSLKENAKVLDIGCNDAALLKTFAQYDIQTLGVDPSRNILENTKKAGIEVLTVFFNGATARKILDTYGQFDLIFATNTLAQIVDLKNFAKGIKMLLKKKGTFVIEVGYVVDMVDKKIFDTIYHEHYSYFSLQSLIELFRNFSLEIYDAEKISNHGGSLRIFIKHKHNIDLKPTGMVKEIVKEENHFRLRSKETYRPYTDFVKLYKRRLKSYLLGLKKRKKKIVGIGAPAKSVVLLNYCGIGSSIIDYIVDSTPLKQNRFMPGVHIPILPEEYLFNDPEKPDYILMLAWTYKEELLKKFQEVRDKGAKIIVPFPHIEII